MRIIYWFGNLLIGNCFLFAILYFHSLGTIVFLRPILLIGGSLFTEGIIVDGLFVYVLHLDIRAMQLLPLCMSLLFFGMLMIDLSFLFGMNYFGYFLMRLGFYCLFLGRFLLMMFFLGCIYFRVYLYIFICFFAISMVDGFLFLLIFICFYFCYFRLFFFLFLFGFFLLDNLLIMIRVLFYSDFVLLLSWYLLFNLIFRLFVYLKNSLLLRFGNRLLKFLYGLFFFVECM